MGLGAVCASSAAATSGPARIGRSPQPYRRVKAKTGGRENRAGTPASATRPLHLVVPPSPSESRLGRRAAPPRIDRRRALDDLIRAQQQRGRDGEAERLGGFEVDDEFELGGLFDRKIGGLQATLQPSPSWYAVRKAHDARHSIACAAVRVVESRRDSTNAAVCAPCLVRARFLHAGYSWRVCL